MKRRRKSPKKTARINPSLLHSLTTVYDLYAHNNIHACITHLQKIIQEHPTNPSAYETLGLVYEDLREYQKSFQFFYLAAFLKKSDVSLWKRLYFLSVFLDLKKERIVILNEIFKLERDYDVLEERIRLCREINDDVGWIKAEVDRINFVGVTQQLVKSVYGLEKSTRTIVCRRLVKTIVENKIEVNELMKNAILVLAFRSRVYQTIIPFIENYFEKTLCVTLILEIAKVMTNKKTKVRLENYSHSEIENNIELILYYSDALNSKSLFKECYEVLKFLEDISKRSSVIDSSNNCYNCNDSVVDNNNNSIVNSNNNAIVNTSNNAIVNSSITDNGSTNHPIHDNVSTNAKNISKTTISKTAIKKTISKTAAKNTISKTAIKNNSKTTVDNISIVDKNAVKTPTNKTKDSLLLFSDFANGNLDLKVQKMIKTYKLINLRSNLQTTVKSKLAPILVKIEKDSTALNYYLELLENNPLDFCAKQAISDIYKKMGEVELSKKYFVKRSDLKIVDGISCVDKRMFRYDNTECQRVKTCFNKISHINVLSLKNRIVSHGSDSCVYNDCTVGKTVDEKIVRDKIVEDKIADEKIIDSKIVGKAVDEKIVEDKIVDSKISENNKISDDTTLDDKIVGKMVIDKTVVDEKISDEKIIVSKIVGKTVDEKIVGNKISENNKTLDDKTKKDKIVDSKISENNENISNTPNNIYKTSTNNIFCNTSNAVNNNFSNRLNINEIINAFKELIVDCESNPFLLSRGQAFRHFNLQNERRRSREIREQIKMQSQHGLTIKEWCHVIINYVLACGMDNRIGEVKRLYYKLLNSIGIRSHRKYFIRIVLVGIKIAVENKDLELMVECVKALENKKPGRYAGLLYFFVGIVGGWKSKFVLVYQRNIQRYFKRLIDFIESNKNDSFSRIDCNCNGRIDGNYCNLNCNSRIDGIGRIDSRVENENIANKTLTNEGLTNKTLADKLSKNKKYYDYHLKVENEYKRLSLYRFLSSWLSGFIHVSSLSLIEEKFHLLNPTLESSIVLSIIRTTKSMGRNNKCPKSYISKGFKLLMALIEDEKLSKIEKEYVYYNLGRTYNQFNILGLAECFYRKCVRSKDLELRKAALFNLVLIYRKSGNVVLYEKTVEMMYECC